MLDSWKCTACHHEWEGDTQDNLCDWCGGLGIVLEKQSVQYMSTFDRTPMKATAEITNLIENGHTKGE